jgi:hypothetical protein
VSFFLKVLVVIALGMVLGLSATRASIDKGFLFGAVRDGPWTAWTTVGSNTIDPYARAVVVSSGLLPLGTDEGLAFYATADSNGRPLDGACDYTVEGNDPPARFWTLGLFDRRGTPVANAADRYALSSQDVLRRDDTRVMVAVSPSARPGNWLPAPPKGRFTLMLSLYESNSGIASAAEAALPVIRRGACR